MPSPSDVERFKKLSRDLRLLIDGFVFLVILVILYWYCTIRFDVIYIYMEPMHILDGDGELSTLARIVVGYLVGAISQHYGEEVGAISQDAIRQVLTIGSLRYGFGSPDEKSNDFVYTEVKKMSDFEETDFDDGLELEDTIFHILVREIDKK